MSAAEALDPVACALFLIAGFSLAGCAQAAWLSCPASRWLAWPLDGGATIRGRRIFGPNKTVRGFVVMVPATSLAFVVVSAIAPSAGRWTGSLLDYSVLGGLAALGFMGAELPNSFVKRQLDIAAGQPASGRLTGPIFLLVDHLDSTCGVLIVLALAVPVPLLTALYVLTVGCVVHLGFSALTFRLGGKERPA